jgi:lysophospholipase L1-like esterase
MGREMVAPICGRLAIPYLDLTAALQTEVRRTGRSHTFVDDMHFNAAAHEAAGKALAEWVEGMWAKQPTR